jgi:hypothetical protein
MGELARKIETAQRRQDAPVMTLLDLVAAIAEQAETDDEVVATVQHLINSGRVQLVGHFKGADVKVG